MRVGIEMRFLIVGFNPISLSIAYLLSDEHDIVIYSKEKDYPEIRESSEIKVKISGETEEAVIQGIVTDLVGVLTESFDSIIIVDTPVNIKRHIERMMELEMKMKSILIVSDGLDIEEDLLKTFDKKALTIGRLLIDIDAEYSAEGNTLTIKKVQNAAMGYISKVHDSSVEAIRDSLKRRGIKLLWFDDIREKVWERTLIFSTLGALEILLNSNNQLLKESKYAQDLIQKLLKEGELIARKQGINLMGVYRTAIKYMSSESDIKSKLIKIKARNIESNIEYFVGALLKYGEKYRLSLPFHSTIYKLLKAYEEIQANK